MLTMAITLEREDERIRVFSDLLGFYLGGTDIERVLGSIIPLAQHCYFRNHQIWVVPKEELDHQQLLETGELLVAFTPTDKLRPPELMVGGQWWTSPQGIEFFCPMENGKIDAVIFERIEKDTENT